MFGNRRWEGYASESPVDISPVVDAALQRAGCRSELRRRSPHVMYDNVHETLVYANPQIEVTLIHVTADPVTRFVYGVAGNPALLTPLTLISATYKSGNRKLLTAVLSGIASRYDAPWDISHNPRFRRAVGLRVLNTAKWKRILKERHLL